MPSPLESAEARQIIADHRPCVTAPNGTGSRCTCDYDCANYWLRARGFKAEAMPEPDRRDQAFPIADEDVDFADEWDDADSAAYHDRVEAGLEPEDSDG